MTRHDIEGDLLPCEEASGSRYLKQLSASVGWHIHELTDLEELPGGVVDSVRFDGQQGVYHIRYGASVEPLDLVELRGLLRPEGFFGPWRVASLAVGLCRRLQAMHLEEIPQLVVHPERVARAGAELVLMPTMAGILPPLPQIRPNGVAGWLHFVAPEVLRTRGLEKSLLYAGDVYSLGRMLHLLSVADWKPDEASSPLELARRRVETPAADPLPTLPAEYGALAGVIDRMCAVHPAERPTLEEVGREFASIAAELEPTRRFSELLKKEQVATAEEALAELQETVEKQVFGLRTGALPLLRADLAMARTPPDCGRAIVELRRLGRAELLRAEVQLRLGRAYARFTGNPQHWRLSCDAFEIAASLLHYPSDVLDEWLASARHVDDPHRIVEWLRTIPPEKCGRSICQLRLDCWRKLKAYGYAWREVASMLTRFGPDPQLIQCALAVGKENSPVKLVKWAHENKQTPNSKVPLGIAWLCAGNFEEAKRHLGKDVHRYSSGEV